MHVNSPPDHRPLLRHVLLGSLVGMWYPVSHEYIQTFPGSKTSSSFVHSGGEIKAFCKGNNGKQVSEKFKVIKSGKQLYGVIDVTYSLLI